MAVDPVIGFLFWSIRRYHGVSRSTLDGMNRKSILLNRDLSYIEDITLDYEVGINYTHKILKNYICV